MSTKESTAVEGDGVVREVRDLVESYVKADLVTIEEPGIGTKALATVRPDGTVMVIPSTAFDSYRERPLRLRGTAIMLSLDSLIDHAKRFKDVSSVVFADDDRAKPALTAVYDYHEPTEAICTDEHGGNQRGMLHRATFAFPLSDEWKAWTEANKAVMSMTDFAAFLEERLPDILALIPGEDELSEDISGMVNALGGDDIIASPTKLMELSRGLQVNEASVVREVVNLASGEGVVQWEQTHNDATGAPLKVPKVFLIGIPVFRNGWLYRIAARLRYRKTQGKIVFWYELWRIDRTFDHAFKEAVERVKSETELPVFTGKPEA